MVPPQARLLETARTGGPNLEVKVGDILILKPGDKVPVDGEVTGETAIDESLVTVNPYLLQRKQEIRLLGDL